MGCPPRRRAPCCGTRSPTPRSRHAANRSSSPGCARQGSGWGCGSARSIPGQVTGYSVTLPGYHDDQGQPLWHSGGRLSGELTLPRLRRRWAADPSAGAERPGTRPPRRESLRFTAAERDAIYQDAAHRAATAAEDIRRCAEHDPAAGADAAWAAADTLHAAARATGSRVLRQAADSYDRAARTPYGRIPGGTRDGDGLRTAARVMALTGTVTGDGIPLATVALLANLVALAVAVTELRHAQRHAAQAAAARTAAEQLHTAVAAARWRVPHAGQAQAPRRARPATAADLAHHDIPDTWPGRPVPSCAKPCPPGQSPSPGAAKTGRAGPVTS